ncbi:MAG: flippase [Clostridiales bacterium]|nr:flippase [Clostridiales bacterium]
MDFKRIVKKLKNNSFVTNTGWLVFDKIFHMLLSLAVTSVTARYLGTEGYGLLKFGLAFINIFTIISKLGIDSILVSELVRDREKTGELVGTTIVLRLLSGLCSIVLTGLFTVVLRPGETVVLFITVVQSISLLFIAFDTVDYYFQSVLKSKYTAVSRSIAYPFVCILRIIFIVMKSDVRYFAWATVLDALLISLVMLFFYFKSEKQSLSFSVSTAKYLLKNSYPFIWANLLVTIYTQMDQIMVSTISGDASGGIYSAAMTIANLWVFVPNAMIDSARPIIMELKAKGNDALYQLRYKQLYAGIIWISIAAGIFFTVFPGIVVRIIYGQSYMDSVPVLMILIWSRLFSLIGTARNIWMICEEQVKYVKWFIGLGAGLNVVLNLLLIPSLGAIGAAVATLITELVSSWLIMAVSKKTRSLFRLIMEAFILKGVFTGKSE